MQYKERVVLSEKINVKSKLLILFSFIYLVAPKGLLVPILDVVDVWNSTILIVVIKFNLIFISEIDFYLLL